MKLLYDGKELSKREKGIALTGVAMGVGIGIIFMVIVDTLLKVVF